MKPSLFVFLTALSVVLSSYAVLPIDKRTLYVTVQGLAGRDLLKEGVARTEFAPLTIDSDQGQVKVKRFDVTLARGSKPVEVVEVATGNRIDLREFADSARSGDRLVIDIKELSGIEQGERSGGEYVIIVPVK